MSLDGMCAGEGQAELGRLTLSRNKLHGSITEQDWELGSGSVPRKKIERVIGKIHEMGTEAGSGVCIPGSP